jgi:hypothetical protein
MQLHIAYFIRKYLVTASVDSGLLLLKRWVIISDTLIADPTDMSGQQELSMLFMVPDKLVKIILKVRGLLSVGRVKTNIFGIWAC